MLTLAAWGPASAPGMTEPRSRKARPTT